MLTLAVAFLMITSLVCLGASIFLAHKKTDNWGFFLLSAFTLWLMVAILMEKSMEVVK